MCDLLPVFGPVFLMLRKKLFQESSKGLFPGILLKNFFGRIDIGIKTTQAG